MGRAPRRKGEGVWWVGGGGRGRWWARERLFMLDAVRALAHLQTRQLALQVLNFVLVITSALTIWRGLALWTNCESPIVVVLSESMEPAFARGDLLVLTNWDAPVRVNDITVFKVEGREVPIVHRVIKVHEDAASGRAFYLTKGDNNAWDDRGLYLAGQDWITRRDVVGRVAAHIPYVGMLTIVMNDFPQVKWAMMAVLALVVLLNREQ